jgi:GNAT superfamily N-acetyltransferase
MLLQWRTGAPDMRVTIRPADASEAFLLTALAHEGKRHWGYPDEWLDVWRDQLTITPAYITDNLVRCGCIDDGRVVGFYALEAEDIGFRLAHLWLAPSSIGCGMGRRIFDHAAQTASDLGARELRIETDPNAEGFYLHLGAERVGESVSLLTGTKRVIPHLRYKLKRAHAEAD